MEIRSEKDDRLNTVKRFTEILPEDQRCFVAFGDIPRPSALTVHGLRKDRPLVPDRAHHPSYMLWLGPVFWQGQAGSWEMSAAFCCCPSCKRIDIQPCGLAAGIDCDCDREELRHIDFCHIETTREADLVQP